MNWRNDKDNPHAEKEKANIALDQKPCVYTWVLGLL